LKVDNKYVAFCDILGFSNSILSRFEEIAEIYIELSKTLKSIEEIDKVELSIYSDSILVISDELPPLIQATRNINWFLLTRDLIVRGGIAYGKFWRNTENDNVLILSDALVKAVTIEKTVKAPIIALSPEIVLNYGYWMPRFETNIFDAPLLHYRGKTFVNLVNRYWYRSAITRLAALSARHPDHREKYDWLLDLLSEIEKDEILIPEDVLKNLVKDGILSKKE